MSLSQFLRLAELPQEIEEDTFSKLQREFVSTRMIVDRVVSSEDLKDISVDPKFLEALPRAITAWEAKVFPYDVVLRVFQER